MSLARNSACGLAAALVLATVAITSAGSNSTAHAAAAADCPWIGSHAPPDERAAMVLAQMTLDEKFQIITAARVPVGIPRLCLPGVTQRGGPGGVNGNLSGVTQLPAPISLAATWDLALANRYGSVIGVEERTKGVSLVGAPTVNMARTPLNGRTYEAYGEDPFLAGQLATATIQGIQSQHVMAMVKHYAAYNQETDRFMLVAHVDERTLREIYLPAFEAAVALGKPAAVMCSYTRLNGATPSCANDWLNNEVLKGEWRFPGVLANDYTAQNRSTAAQNANGGLDYEIPVPNRYAAPLRTALANGEVSQARIDDMVRRILHSMFATGLVDNPVTGSPDAIATTTAHRELGRDVSEAGTVLLKNTDHVLPLSNPNAKILVVGPDASTYPVTSGGSSAGTVADSIVTPLAGITAHAGSANVQYVEGVEPVTPYNALLPGLPNLPQSTLTTPRGDLGIQCTFYDAANTVLGTRIDKSINFDWNINQLAIYPNEKNAPPTGTTSEQWDGTFTAPASGAYTFEIFASGSATVAMDGIQVASVTTSGQTRWTMHLTAGSAHTLQVKAHVPASGRVKLGWQPPSGAVAPSIAAAADQAKSADMAIVFVNDYAEEGARFANDLVNDRPSLSLPGNQNALIEAVARANPNTIVVLNTGSAVIMPWADRVKAIVEAWYSGQSAGTAIASVLFGDTEASGRLPISFPTKEVDTPTSGDPTRYPGVNNDVTYGEGLDIGYRWYDAHDIKPLFPFGYGLSYTTFRYDHLQVTPSVAQDTTPIRAKFRLTNTGSRAGSEVAQIYLSLPASTGEPPKRLVAWVRVPLRAGESQNVEVTIDPKAVNHPMSYWNTSTNAWTTADGEYSVLVGSSSRSIVQTGRIAVHRRRNGLIAHRLN